MVEYVYSPLNQLKEVKSDGVTVGAYTYSGNGLRRSKTANGTITKYYWNGQNMINEAVNGEITATNKYDAYGLYHRSGVGDIVKNDHGDVIGVISQGTITHQYNYDAYGNQKISNTNDTNPFRYCGEYYDDESGLIYLRNRYYDPDLGRFINVDPIKDGTIWYTYCDGNPVNRIDKNGLEWGYIRDFVGDLDLIFGDHKYIFNEGNVQVQAGGDNFKRKGTFYFNGEAEVAVNGGRSYKKQSIASNDNGYLYMERANFYRAMNIAYTQAEQTFEVTELGNNIKSIVVGAIVTYATKGANLWAGFSAGTIAGFGVDAMSWEAGVYKVIHTVGEVYDVSFDMYQTIWTQEYYIQKQDTNGNNIWVRADTFSVTNHFGWYKESVVR